MHPSSSPQIEYSEMLNKVEPLRNELSRLEGEADKNKQKQEQVNRLVAELEKSITKYKEEYAQLISQAQAIKADLEAVEIKVSSAQKHSWEIWLRL